MKTIEGFDKVEFGTPLGGCQEGLWGLLSGRWYRLSTDKAPVGPGFVVKPDMIQNTRFSGMFGRIEGEGFAAVLVHFAQQMQGWEPFTVSQLDDFRYGAFNAPNAEFFAKLGFLVEQGGRYQFTLGFVQVVLSAQQ